MELHPTVRAVPFGGAAGHFGQTDAFEMKPFFVTLSNHNH